MAAPDGLIRLVEQFRDNRETYLSPEFNETALRLQFIDPMFELLGWDVHNRKGNAEVYKEVVHEDSLKIGASTNAPDYSTRWPVYLTKDGSIYLSVIEPGPPLTDAPRCANQTVLLRVVRASGDARQHRLVR